MQAVPARIENLRRWVHRPKLGDGCKRFRGDILKFEGDHIHASGESAGGVEIIIWRIHFLIGDLPRRAIGRGIHRMHAIPHPPCGNGKHSPELSAAEDADGLAGKNHLPERIDGSVGPYQRKIDEPKRII